MEGATVLRLGGVRARRRGQGYGNLISKPRSDKRQFSGVLGYNAGRGVYKEVKGGRDKGRRLRRLAVAARDEAQIPNRPRRVASRACRVAFSSSSSSARLCRSPHRILATLFLAYRSLCRVFARLYVQPRDCDEMTEDAEQRC